MSEFASRGTAKPTDKSFRRFLKSHRTSVLVILLAAFSWRVFLVIGFPHGAYDEIRYTAPAVNMLAGHGFSMDIREPYLPSDHTMPLYPLVIAGVYALFGQHNSAVRIVQGAIDTLTCLLVAFLAFNLAPSQLKTEAAFLGLIIYGFLSWFTVFWTRYVLTETLAIFLTMLVVALGVWAMRGRPLRWLIVGVAGGLALLTRADSALLLLAFGLFFGIQAVRFRSTAPLINCVLFGLSISIVLVPWTARNYIVFGKSQPFASEYGRPRGEYVPTGYILWIKTWMTDETNYHAGDLIFQPGSRAFQPRELPPQMFDSVEERERVVNLIAQYNQRGEMTRDLDDQFRALADERISRAPMRFYVWLPLKRIVSMWLTGFTTTNRLHMLLRILLVLPILIGGIIGFGLIIRGQPLAHLLISFIFLRTIFFAYYGAEARYIVEAYPPMIAASSVAAAALWQYLRLWKPP